MKNGLGNMDWDGIGISGNMNWELGHFDLKGIFNSTLQKHKSGHLLFPKYNTKVLPLQRSSYCLANYFD